MPEKRLLMWDGWRSAGRVLLTFVLLYLLVAFLSYGSAPYSSENARRASCMSNMKQLGLALAQYTQDYGGDLPNEASSGGNGWREAIYPYVKSTEIYRCPDDQRDNNHASPVNLLKSYAANALCLSSGKKRAAILQLPSATVLVTDTRGFDGEDWDMTSPAFLPSSGCELYTHKPSHYFYQHPSGTLNLLFADGHVKAMKPDATLTPINLWTPNNTSFTVQGLLNVRAILAHTGGE